MSGEDDIAVVIVANGVTRISRIRRSLIFTNHGRDYFEYSALGGDDDLQFRSSSRLGSFVLNGVAELNIVVNWND